MEPTDAPFCQQHSKPAVGSCPRCGIFVCGDCVGSRETLLCGPCEQRRADTGLVPGTYSFGAAFRVGLGLMRARWGLVAAVTGAVTVPEVILDQVARDAGLKNTLLVSNLVGATLGLLATLVCLAAMDASAHGRPLGPKEALRKAASSWAVVFAARLLAGIKVALWSLLLIVPGIVKSVQLSLVTPLAFFVPNKDSHALSVELTEGHRWSLFGLMVGTTTAALAAALVPWFALAAAAELAPVLATPSEFLTTWLGNALLVFPEAATLGAYYGLRHRLDEDLLPDRAVTAAAGATAEPGS